MFLFIFILILLATMNLSDDQTRLATSIYRLDLANITSSIAVAVRQSLGSVPYRLTEKSKDWVKHNLLDYISTNITDCHIHSKGCWGYFVVRTAYAEGDDERVVAAMVHLDDAVENKIQLWRQRDGPTASHEQLDDEARDRYHSVLIEDPSLHGASFLQAREFFRSWAAPFVTDDNDMDNEMPDGLLAKDPDLDDVGRTPRFRAFILLDDQVLSNMQTFPARGDLEAFEKTWKTENTEWVKLVGTNDEGLMGALGVTAYDLLEVFGFMCDLDNGVQTFPSSGIPLENERDTIWEMYDF